ncbi:MAG: alpha/beta hydrolase [Opitutaceae bacterium]
MIKRFILMALLLSNHLWAEVEIPLWNTSMPGISCSEAEIIQPMKPNDETIRITNVSEPTLTYFGVNSDTPSPIIIICPGGGYNILSFNKEGTDVAEWLKTVGISAVVLKYRVPKNREGALLDAQEAVKLVRSKASAWNIDPDRVGMLGFSAGGHLTAACSNSEIRPNFSILIYPAYLFKEGGIHLVEGIKVDHKTPPAFVVQTQDDKKYYRSSLAYAAALDAANIPVELHLFAKGGHGYGLSPSKHPVSNWPQLCEAWMREMEYIE